MKTVVKKSKWTIIALFAVVMCVWLGIGMFATASQDKPTIEKVEASLYDNIAFHYYTSVPEGYSNPYMKFELGGRTYTETEVRKEDNYYIFDFDGIAPQDINAEVTATLYATKSSAEKQCDTIKKSVDRYCEELLGHTAAELGIINEKYTAMKKLIADLRSYSSEVQQAGGKEATLAYTFTLNKKVNINDVVLKLTKVDSGETYAAWDFEQQADKDGKAVYTAYFDAIAPVECRTALSLQLFVKGEASGSAKNYRFDTYVNSVQNSDDTNAKLARAYYQYGVSAMGYAVNIPFDETYDAVGLNVELKSDSGKYYKRPVAEDNCVSLSGIPNDTYTVTTDIFGIEQEIGAITVDSKHVNYPLDLGQVFANKTYLDNGTMTYDFATSSAYYRDTANGGSKAVAKTLPIDVPEITGPFSVTARYKISESEVITKNEDGSFVTENIRFGMRVLNASKAGATVEFMKNSANKLYIAGWTGTENLNPDFGSIRNGVWTHSDYSRALTTTGLWVKMERDASGKITVYFGTGDTSEKMTMIGSYIPSNVDTEPITQIMPNFTLDKNNVNGFSASIEHINVSVAQNVEISLSGKNCTAKDAVFTFTPNAGAPVTGVANADNKILVALEPGTHEISTLVYGVEKSLGTITIVKGQEEYDPIDLGQVFADKTYLDNGTMTYDFATSSVYYHDDSNVTSAIAKTLPIDVPEITGPFSVTARYKISESEVITKNEDGSFVTENIRFGMRVLNAGKKGATVEFMKNTANKLYIAGWTGTENLEPEFGTISDGVWTHSDYSRALTTTGLWVKTVRDASGTITVYFGTGDTSAEMTMIGSYIPSNVDTEPITQILPNFTLDKNNVNGFSASIENINVSVVQNVEISLSGKNCTTKDAIFTFTPQSGTPVTGVANADNKLLVALEPGTYEVSTMVYGVEKSLGTITIIEGQEEYGPIDLGQVFANKTYLDNGTMTYDFATSSVYYHDDSNVTSAIAKTLPIDVPEITGAFSVTARYKINASEVIAKKQDGTLIAENIRFGMRVLNTSKLGATVDFMKNTGNKLYIAGWKGSENLSPDFGSINEDIWNHSDYSRALTTTGLWVKMERDASGKITVYFGTGDTSEEMTKIGSYVASVGTNAIKQVLPSFTLDKNTVNGFSASIEHINVSVAQNVEISLSGKNCTAKDAFFTFTPNSGAPVTGVANANNKILVALETGTYKVSTKVYGVKKSLGTITIIEGQEEYSPIDLGQVFADKTYLDNGTMTYDFATSSVYYRDTANGGSKAVAKTLPIDVSEITGAFSVTARYKISEAEVITKNENGAFVTENIRFGMRVLNASKKGATVEFMKNTANKLYIAGWTGTENLEPEFGSISNGVWTHSAYSNALTSTGLWVKTVRDASGTITVYFGTGDTSEEMTMIGSYIPSNVDTEPITQILPNFTLDKNNVNGFSASIENIEISVP